jgi:hypothetical protein
MCYFLDSYLEQQQQTLHYGAEAERHQVIVLVLEIHFAVLDSNKQQKRLHFAEADHQQQNY